jgi:hypothetical protein
VIAAGVPLLAAALAVDAALTPVIRRGQRSNSYRLLVQAPQT